MDDLGPSITLQKIAAALERIADALERQTGPVQVAAGPLTTDEGNLYTSAVPGSVPSPGILCARGMTGTTLTCQKPRGHHGDHQDGLTAWNAWAQ